MSLRVLLCLLGSACCTLVGCADETESLPPTHAAVDAAHSPLDASVEEPLEASQPAQPAADATIPDAAASLQRPRRALVAPALWVEQAAADDPFADRPSSTHCDLELGYMAELLAGEGAFSVDTGWCSYITAQQPARVAAAAGETVKLRLWHFDLSAPEPAEAHVAVMVDGMTLFEERIAIPLPAQLIAREVPLPRQIAAGAPVYFHLHNHGANSWSLVELSVGPVL